MLPDARTELRALALWHTRRRAVDDALGPLLEYGPVAVSRVADRLTDMRDLVEDERAAFEAFVEVLNHRAGEQQDAVVLEMFARRPETGD